MRKRAPLLLCLLAVLSLVIGVRADTKEEKAQIKAFKAEMKSADEAGRIRLIDDLAKSGNPGASKAIAPYMSNRSTAVKVAAIRAVGSLKEKSNYGRLLGMIKKVDKEPMVLAAVLDAIGEYGNKGSMKELTKVAKKWLFKDHEVASAAARAIGKIPEKDSIDTLIKLMDMTFPRAGGSGGSISEATQTLLEQSRPAIIESLQNLTGMDFKDATAWKNFWEKNSKTWKPGREDPDMTKLMEWVDPGYGFKLERPSVKWEMARGKDKGKDYERYRIMLNRIIEEVSVAYCRVEAYSNASNQMPRDRAAQYEKTYRKTFRNIKDESWKEGPTKIGKASGFQHSFTGMDSRGNVCLVHNIYVTAGSIMYILEAWQRSGAPEDVVKDLKKIVKSFEIFD